MRRLWQRLDIAVTCNWFSIGLTCAVRGHQWRTSRPTRCVSITDCARCGEYRGASVSDGASCRWYRRPTDKDWAAYRDLYPCSAEFGNGDYCLLPSGHEGAHR